MRRFKAIDQRWQALNQRGLATLTTEEKQAYIRADLELGNILRASEDRCALKYGLDAIICWPRLWLVLPEEVKTELSAARSGLNLNARLWLWRVLFLLWAPIFGVWWPLPLGVGAAWLAQRWMVQAAQVYEDLVESAFDLYRFALYGALHWPLPTNPAEERALGQGLTEYLWHGSDQGFPEFTKLKP